LKFFDKPTTTDEEIMIRTLLAAGLSIAFVSGQVLAHDDKPKPKAKPEAAKDDRAGKSEDHKKSDHKGKDHEKKH
jgi:hypothetical protein